MRADTDCGEKAGDHAATPVQDGEQSPEKGRITHSSGFVLWLG